MKFEKSNVPNSFYRAMLGRAQLIGYATVSRPSVCPSVYLSATFWYVLFAQVRIGLLRE